MTRDDIIRMAREAGLWPAVTDSFLKELQEFAALVAAAEREACAKLCIEMASWHGDLVTAAYDSAADAIRKRGQS
jgi:hypothetical protein